MAKDRSFAAKVAKSHHLTQKHCPVCGEELSSVKLIETQKNPDKEGWRFKEKYIKVCKCNEKEILG